MKGSVYLLTTLLIALLAYPAPAGIIFNKKPKINPAERVPSLIMVLKTDKDERKRESAAEELRYFDTATFPEIVPVLMEAAQIDPKAGVRLDAIQSLAHIRPVSQEVGMALEQAAEKDASFRVRLQTRGALLQYRLSGYHGAGKDAPADTSKKVKTEEPPLADPPSTPPAVSSSRSTSSAYKPMKTQEARTPKLETPPAAPPADGPDLTPPQ